MYLNYWRRSPGLQTVVTSIQRANSNTHVPHSQVCLKRLQKPCDMQRMSVFNRSCSLRQEPEGLHLPVHSWAFFIPLEPGVLTQPTWLHLGTHHVSCRERLDGHL